MRSLIKRCLIGAYCRGWLSATVVDRLFSRFNLSEA